MRPRLVLGTATVLVVAALSLAWAATNLNSSRSNIYRLTYPTDLVSPAQAKALLADLDRLGPADDARLKQWLAANFKRHGIAADRVKKIVILPKSRDLKEITIILLTNPTDEAQAVATTVKSSKSNTSD
jgi:hypothetical protein